VLSFRDDQGDAVAAPEPGGRIVGGAALRGQAQVVEGDEQVLARAFRPDEGESSRALALASVQGRNDADHAGPV